MIVPAFSSWPSEAESIRWRRMTTEVRSATEVMANSRWPEASLRSRMGEAVSNRREVWPAVAARWRIRVTSSASLEATGGPGMRLPSANDSTTLSWPRMWMFSTSGRSSSGFRLPPPIRPRTRARKSRRSSSVNWCRPAIRAVVLCSWRMPSAMAMSWRSMTSAESFWRSMSRYCSSSDSWLALKRLKPELVSVMSEVPRRRP